HTMPRLRLNDNTMRELIGIPVDADFASAEPVQAMVVWADGATCPIGGKPLVSGKPTIHGPLVPIARERLSPAFVPFPVLLTTHRDCVAPGMPVREIRPPLTDLSPLAPEFLNTEMIPTVPPTGGPSLRQAIFSRRSARDFQRHSISRNQFLTINRLAFRTGTFAPLLPQGSHVALVRPFWVVHDVTGIEQGVWYYHPVTEQWSCMKYGDSRMELRFAMLEQPACGEASAVCIMVANLRQLLGQAGPDT